MLKVSLWNTEIGTLKSGKKTHLVPSDIIPHKILFEVKLKWVILLIKQEQKAAF